MNLISSIPTQTPKSLIALIISILIHMMIGYVWFDLQEKPAVMETPARVIEVEMSSPKPSPKIESKPVVKPQAEPVVQEKPKPVLKPRLEPKPAPKPVPVDKAPAPVQESAAPPEPAPAASSTPVQSAPAPAPVSFTEASYKSPGLRNPPTRYPRIALERQWEGTVVLRVQVLASGLAGEIKIERSSGHELLDDSTIEQVKEWHFIPAQKNDQPADSWVIVPIEFKLKH